MTSTQRSTIDAALGRGSLSAMVLASGDNARMRSLRPKPLHVLCGRPILFYVLDAIAGCDVRRAAVVLGHGSERVAKRMHDYDAPFVIDIVDHLHARGTGDAVSAGLTAFSFDDMDDEEDLLIVAGDMPLVSAETLVQLVDQHRARSAACTVLTVAAAESGPGQIVRGRDDRITSLSGNAIGAIDEPKSTRSSSRSATSGSDADPEAATMAFVFRKNLLAPSLRRLDPVEGEYYVSDVIDVLAYAGHRVESMCLNDATESMTVDDRPKMAEVEAELRRRTNLRWQRSGVTLVDPTATYIDTTVELATDVTIFPNTMLQGRTVVGEGAELGPDTRLTDCMIGSRARVEKTVGRDAEVGPGAVVGPFAVLESGAQVGPGDCVLPFSVATSTDPATQC